MLFRVLVHLMAKTFQYISSSHVEEFLWGCLPAPMPLLCPNFMHHHKISLVVHWWNGPDASQRVFRPWHNGDFHNKLPKSLQSSVPLCLLRLEMLTKICKFVVAERLTLRLWGFFQFFSFNTVWSEQTKWCFSCWCLLFKLWTIKFQLCKKHTNSEAKWFLW